MAKKRKSTKNKPQNKPDDAESETMDTAETEVEETVDDTVEDDEVEDEDNLQDNAEVDDDKAEKEEKEEDKEEAGQEDLPKPEGDDKCLYKYASDEEEEEEEEIVFDEDENKGATSSSDEVPPEQRITKPFLTKYERVRLISDRTKQLLLGAKPMVKNTENLHEKKIAELELKNNVMPLYIERPLPNGKKEIWHLNELIH
jgi:DNA-directed RNA polymerase subunit K/omega